MQAESYWHLPTDAKPMFCFNPACPSSKHRMFLPSEGPKHHTPTCSKWFVDTAFATRLAKPRKIEVNAQKEDSLLFASPMQAMVRFFQRKQSLKAKISSMYEQMKESVLGCIQSCKNGKLCEVQHLGKELEVLRQLILDGVNLAENKKSKDAEEIRRSTSIGINNLINTRKYNIPFFKNFELFHVSNWTEKSAILKQHIINQSKTLCKEVEIQGGYQRLQYEDMLNVEAMLLQNRGPLSESLSKLVSWQESDFIITQEEEKNTGLRCPLCSYNFQLGWMHSHGKSDIEHQVLLINHLLDSHLPYLGLCYSYRISRNSVKEIPFSQLLYLVRNCKYDRLDIYDAANTKNYRFDVNPRCLSVLMTGENAKVEDFESYYCIIQSPEDAAYKIVLLMDEVCAKQGKTVRIINFKRNYYNLYATLTAQYSFSCKFEDKATPPQPKYKLEKGKMKNDM